MSVNHVQCPREPEGEMDMDERTRLEDKKGKRKEILEEKEEEKIKMREIKVVLQNEEVWKKVEDEV